MSAGGHMTGPKSPLELRRRYASAIARVVHGSRAGRWKLGETVLTNALAASLASWGGADRGESVESYLATLHLDDLTLAAACRADIIEAWNQFIEHYRPIVYGAARAVAGDE